jgi:hypothetical protein
VGVLVHDSVYPVAHIFVLPTSLVTRGGKRWSRSFVGQAVLVVVLVLENCG